LYGSRPVWEAWRSDSSQLHRSSVLSVGAAQVTAQASALLPTGAASLSLHWDGEPGAVCNDKGQPALSVKLGAATEGKGRQACLLRCLGESKCEAVTLVNNSICQLHSLCNYITPSSKSEVLFRPSRLKWPTKAADVRWQSKVALVVASYKKSLAFLTKLSPNISADVAV
jgi:hypothetical protein